jgi:CRISPR/Cas system-associated exonuclease Cas4 (RecB family)
MTVWRHSVSWSKLVLALECPRSLQYAIEKKPTGKVRTNFYQALGKVVQFVFEQYFNQKVNLRPGCDTPEVLLKITDRVFASRWFNYELQPSYGYGQDQALMEKMTKAQVTNGLKIMRDLGMLHLELRSEVMLNGVFNGFRMFAYVDFLREGKTGDYIIDGKGHAEKNADPRQVKYYALNRASSGRRIAGGGLLYFQHDYEPVDVTPKALYEFANTEVASVQPLFNELKKGIPGDLEARPEKKKCYKCNWNQVCRDAFAAKPEVNDVTTAEVTFGDKPPEV